MGLELDGHHRQVLVLRFLVEMTVDEMAGELEVPAGTVNSRIHRRLIALRKRLAREQEGVQRA